MIQVKVNIEVAPRHRVQLLKLLLQLEQNSRKEPGCISYSVYERSHEPHLLSIFEEWQDEAHLTLHEGSALFHEVTQKLPQLTIKVELVKTVVSQGIHNSIIKRRSVRSFTQDKLTHHQIERLLRAAMQAPTAHNFQPWEFIVVEDRDLQEKISVMSPFAKPARKAATLIIVCANLPAVEKDPVWWPQDVSAATQNILLQAVEDQLGAVWLGFWPEKDRVDALRALLKIPDSVVPFSVIAVGIPEKEIEKTDRFDSRKIHYQQY